MAKKQIPVIISSAPLQKKDISLTASAETIPPINKENRGGEQVVLKKKPSFFKLLFKIIAYTAIFVIVALVFFSFFAEKNIISENKQTSWFNKIPAINQFKSLIESADKKLKGEEGDRVNILLLGMGGKKHSGGNLTDTIMLVSLQPSTKKAAMLSIPRDLAVPIEGLRGLRKINNINALAESRELGSGGNAVIKAVGELLNIQIDYYIRADFEGFIKIIDELGGVTVDVENTLDDYSYPVLGKEKSYPYSARYEHLHIEKGIQKMDGDTALKYARSRHGAGSEGSDFARARRQQKIIEAAKDKALSVNMLFRPTAIKNIFDALQEHISTNIEIWEMLRAWDLFKDVKKDRIVNKVLDNSADGLLYSTVGDGGAYLLMPKSGNFLEIQNLANNLLQETPEGTESGVISEAVNIEVQNGTWIGGLAGQVSVGLKKAGFKVVNIKNSSRQNFQKSVIYDLTYGKKINSLQILKQKTGANVALGLPDWIVAEVNKQYEAEADPKLEKPDFILVLGQDAAQNPGLNN